MFVKFREYMGWVPQNRGFQYSNGRIWMVLPPWLRKPPYGTAMVSHLHRAVRIGGSLLAPHHRSPSFLEEIPKKVTGPWPAIFQWFENMCRRTEHIVSSCIKCLTPRICGSNIKLEFLKLLKWSTRWCLLMSTNSWNQDSGSLMIWCEARWIYVSTKGQNEKNHRPSSNPFSIHDSDKLLSSSLVRVVVDQAVEDRIALAVIRSY